MRVFILFFILILLFVQKSFSQVGINTETPNPLGLDNVVLDVNGKVILRDFDEVSDSQNIKFVGVNDNGVLVKLNGDPTNVSFFQSNIGTKYTGTEVDDFNAGKNYLVPWDPSSDVIINNLVTMDSSDQSFIFQDKGMYEISGVLNLGIKMGTGYVALDNHRVAINLSIQYKKKDQTAWTDLTATRMLFVAAMLYYDYTATTIITPQTLFNFEAGDRIRMVVNKPFGEKVNAFEVSKPTGTTISKQLKIVAL